MANSMVFGFSLRRMVTLLSLAAVTGCAGEEVDFSKPPSEISGRQKSPSETSSAAINSPEHSPEHSTVAPPLLPSGQASGGSTSTADASQAEPAKQPDNQQQSGTFKADNSSSSTSNAQPQNSSGKSLAKLRSLKSPPSAEDATGSGKVTQTPARQFSDNPGLLREWERLTGQLPMRWYLSVDAQRRVVCSSENLSGVEVLQLPSTDTNPEHTVGIRRRENSNLKAAPERMRVWPIQNTINSLTLVPDKNRVLIATMDGRLQTRRFFDDRSLDFFAARAVGLEDELQPGVQADTTGIVFVRMPDTKHVLTVNGKGLLSLWKSEDVVQDKPRLQQWLGQVASGNADDLKNAIANTSPPSVTPLRQHQLSSSRVLDFCVDETLQTFALVTDPGFVSVFALDDLKLLAQWHPNETAGTTAVSCVFTGETELACAMLDGSLSLLSIPASNQLPGSQAMDQATPPRSMVPERTLIEIADRERKSAISCLMLDQGARLFLGRFDGTVAFIKWPQADNVAVRVEELGRKQSAAVTSFWRSGSIVWSLGLDRSATLCFADETSVAGQTTVEKFTLAKDETLGTGLPAKTPASDEGLAQQELTRPLPATSHSDHSDRTPVTDVALTAQPSDRFTLLLQHLFRQSFQSTLVDQLRTDLHAYLSVSGSNSSESKATTADPTPVGQIDVPGIIVNEASEDTFLCVSNDGDVVAMATDYEAQQGRAGNPLSRVLMWDVPSGLLLRDWRSFAPAGPIHYFNDRHCIWMKGDSALLAGSSGAIVPVTPHQVFSGIVLSDDTGNQTIALILGLLQTGGKADSAFRQITMDEIQTLDGTCSLNAVGLSDMELLEGAVTQIIASETGDSVIAVLRQGNLEKIIEVSRDISVAPAEITRTMLKTEWEPNGRYSPAPPADGTLVLLASPSGRNLIAWGIYGGQPTMRFFHRAAGGWSEDVTTTIRNSQARLDLAAVSQPAAFIDRRDNRLILATNLGLSVLNARNAKLEKALPVPSIDGKRPVTLLSPAGDFVYLADSDGNVWYVSLPGIDKPPVRFSAHTGQITKMAISANHRFLATFGKDGRIRVWDLNAIHSKSTEVTP